MRREGKASRGSVGGVRVGGVGVGGVGVGGVSHHPPRRPHPVRIQSGRTRLINLAAALS